MMCDGGAGEWREEKFQVVNNMAGRQNGTKKIAGKVLYLAGRKDDGSPPPSAMRHAHCFAHASCSILSNQYQRNDVE